MLHNHRAFHLWTEEYLKTEYGNLTVRLEARAEANTKVPVGGQGILGRDTVEHFMTNYQTMDAYVISQIPQPMETDIAIPPCLRFVYFVYFNRDYSGVQWLFYSCSGTFAVLLHLWWQLSH